MFSKLLLARSLSSRQWAGVVLVVAGLGLTALDSVALGGSVFVGSLLIVAGSSFHGERVRSRCDGRRVWAGN